LSYLANRQTNKLTDTV